ncbi:hypothetical protein ScPMuIL_008201 [Solemya velum]
MVHTCVVWGCTNRANAGATKKQYFDIPKVIYSQGTETEKLSSERRNLWLVRINREGFDPDPTKRHYKVCSDHFITGKKADLYDNTNPDWAPSQKMGPQLPDSCPSTDPQSSKKRYQRAKGRQEKVKRFKAAEALLDLQNDTHPTGLNLSSNSANDSLSDEVEIEHDNDFDNEAVEMQLTDGQLLDMMRKEVQRLTTENMVLREKIKESVLSPESLDDDKAKHYTGLDIETLMTIVNYLEPSIPGRMNNKLFRPVRAHQAT